MDRDLQLQDRPEGEEGEVERLRSMLYQAGKLAELGTQMAALVHEMNQPLVAIKAFAQMIKAAETDGVTERRARFIEEQADVLARMVARLRSHSRQTSGRSVCELGKAVEAATELMEHAIRKAGVHLDLELEPAPLEVPLDEIHAQQILVNLLSNAVDAVEGREDKRLLVSARRFEGWAELDVADSGVGISEEIAERVLEPFFTTKGPDRGTGLGLPICREILESCGGEMTIRSGGAVAKGGFRTVVEVRLPLAESLSPELEERDE